MTNLSENTVTNQENHNAVDESHPADSIIAQSTPIIPTEELDLLCYKICELNSLQHIIYNNQLASDITALEKLHDNICTLNNGKIVWENPKHLVPLIKNNVKIMSARLNTLLEQCIAGAEVANLYDIDKPYVKDYNLEEFSNAVDIIAKQRIAGIRDIQITTTWEEAASSYLVKFKTDNSTEEKYNTFVQISLHMLTEVAFDAINSEVISHLGLPSHRDEPVMHVLD